MAERVRRAVGVAAAREECAAEILDHWAWGGRIFDDELISLIHGHVTALGYHHRDLARHAGHDAYFLALRPSKAAAPMTVAEEQSGL